MRPIAQSDGHDAPGLIDELVPSVAAVVDDVALRGEDSVGQPVLAHELPHVLDRIELGSTWGQRQQRDVGRHVDLVAHVPSRLIQQQDGMRVGVDGGGDLGQMQVHRGAGASWQHQRRALALGGADCPEQIGRGGALVLRRRWAAAALRPAAGDAVLLADPGFVLESDLYALAGANAVADLRQRGGEVFLNVAKLPGSWAW